MICFHHQENRVVQSCKNIVYHNIDVGLKDKKKKKKFLNGLWYLFALTMYFHGQCHNF